MSAVGSLINYRCCPDGFVFTGSTASNNYTTKFLKSPFVTNIKGGACPYFLSGLITTTGSSTKHTNVTVTSLRQQWCLPLCRLPGIFPASTFYVSEETLSASGVAGFMTSVMLIVLWVRISSGSQTVLSSFWKKLKQRPLTTEWIVFSLLISIGILLTAGRTMKYSPVVEQSRGPWYSKDLSYFCDSNSYNSLAVSSSLYKENSHIKKNNNVDGAGTFNVCIVQSAIWVYGTLSYSLFWFALALEMFNKLVRRLKSRALTASRTWQMALILLYPLITVFVFGSQGILGYDGSGSFCTTTLGFRSFYYQAALSISGQKDMSPQGNRHVEWKNAIELVMFDLPILLSAVGGLALQAYLLAWIRSFKKKGRKIGPSLSLGGSSTSSWFGDWAPRRSSAASLSRHGGGGMANMLVGAAASGGRGSGGGGGGGFCSGHGSDTNSRRMSVAGGVPVSRELVSREGVLSGAVGASPTPRSVRRAGGTVGGSVGVGGSVWVGGGVGGGVGRSGVGRNLPRRASTGMGIEKHLVELSENNVFASTGQQQLTARGGVGQESYFTPQRSPRSARIRPTNSRGGGGGSSRGNGAGAWESGDGSCSRGPASQRFSSSHVVTGSHLIPAAVHGHTSSNVAAGGGVGGGSSRRVSKGQLLSSAFIAGGGTAGDGGAGSSRIAPAVVVTPLALSSRVAELVNAEAFRSEPSSPRGPQSVFTSLLSSVWSGGGNAGGRTSGAKSISPRRGCEVVPVVVSGGGAAPVGLLVSPHGNYNGSSSGGLGGTRRNQRGDSNSVSLGGGGGVDASSVVGLNLDHSLGNSTVPPNGTSHDRQPDRTGGRGGGGVGGEGGGGDGGEVGAPSNTLSWYASLFSAAGCAAAAPANGGGFGGTFAGIFNAILINFVVCLLVWLVFLTYRLCRTAAGASHSVDVEAYAVWMSCVLTRFDGLTEQSWISACGATYASTNMPSPSLHLAFTFICGLGLQIAVCTVVLPSLYRQRQRDLKQSIKNRERERLLEIRKEKEEHRQIELVAQRDVDLMLKRMEDAVAERGVVAEEEEEGGREGGGRREEKKENDEDS